MMSKIKPIFAIGVTFSLLPLIAFIWFLEFDISSEEFLLSERAMEAPNKLHDIADGIESGTLKHSDEELSNFFREMAIAEKLRLEGHAEKTGAYKKLKRYLLGYLLFYVIIFAICFYQICNIEKNEERKNSS